MSKTTHGIPATISREDYVAMLEQYGFEPEYIKSLTFASAGIHAVVFDRHPEHGGRYLTNPDGDGGFAKTAIFIPIVEPRDELEVEK